jgi:hypothetical protein
MAGMQWGVPFNESPFNASKNPGEESEEKNRRLDVLEQRDSESEDQDSNVDVEEQAQQAGSNLDQEVEDEADLSQKSQPDLNQTAPTPEPELEIGTHTKAFVESGAEHPDLHTELHANTQQSNQSTLSSVRSEMARRALNLEVDEDEEEEEQGPVDETFDDRYVSGSTAELSEAGYAAVSMCCCPLEMTVFAERLVTHLGFVVCNEGSLQGMVAWYYCKNQTRTFAELVEETIGGADGECAWVGTESMCPTVGENCPHFPDTTAHRRRNCNNRKVLNTKTTTGAPGALTVSEQFQCKPDEATYLEFGKSNVIVNNLGGKGPSIGEKMLVFQGISMYNGVSIDLVIKSIGLYTPGDATENGVQGNHAQINLQSGNAVELQFKFQETLTNKTVELPEFYFTLLDLDQGNNQHRERFYVSGYAHIVKEDINDFEEEPLVDGRTLFKSLQQGHSWDDPSDPDDLGVVVSESDSSKTVDQRKRAVMLVFRKTSEFTVTFEVTQKEGSETANRNFMFAGKSSLLTSAPFHREV